MRVFQSCEVMAAASVNRPGGPQTIEKSQLILKGNLLFFHHLHHSPSLT